MQSLVKVYARLVETIPKYIWFPSRYIQGRVARLPTSNLYYHSVSCSGKNKLKKSASFITMSCLFRDCQKLLAGQS